MAVRKKLGDKPTALAAKKLYCKGFSLDQIASQLKVSLRTVQRWKAASTSNWDTDKSEWQTEQANTSGRIHAPAPLSPLQGNLFPIPSPKPKPPRPRGQQVDDLDICKDVILDLRDEITDRKCKGAGMGQIAMALARLIELKRRIAPPTVDELVGLAIELGYGPDEFIAELQRRWKNIA